MKPTIEAHVVKILGKREQRALLQTVAQKMSSPGQEREALLQLVKELLQSVGYTMEDVRKSEAARKIFQDSSVLRVLLEEPKELKDNKIRVMALFIYEKRDELVKHAIAKAARNGFDPEHQEAVLFYYQQIIVTLLATNGLSLMLEFSHFSLIRSP